MAARGEHLIRVCGYVPTHGLLFAINVAVDTAGLPMTQTNPARSNGYHFAIIIQPELDAPQLFKFSNILRVTTDMVEAHRPHSGLFKSKGGIKHYQSRAGSFDRLRLVNVSLFDFAKSRRERDILDETCCRLMYKVVKQHDALVPGSDYPIANTRAGLASLSAASWAHFVVPRFTGAHAHAVLRVLSGPWQAAIEVLAAYAGEGTALYTLLYNALYNGSSESEAGIELYLRGTRLPEATPPELHAAAFHPVLRILSTFAACPGALPAIRFRTLGAPPTRCITAGEQHPYSKRPIQNLEYLEPTSIFTIANYATSTLFRTNQVKQIIGYSGSFLGDHRNDLFLTVHCNIHLQPDTRIIDLSNNTPINLIKSDWPIDDITGVHFSNNWHYSDFKLLVLLSINYRFHKNRFLPIWFDSDDARGWFNGFYAQLYGGDAEHELEV
jgi:hypothetical protein